MANVTIDLSKWYHWVLATLPLLAFMGSAWLWFDTRYMHREISDTRFIELQIRLVQRNVKDYHRMMEDGITLSPEDQLDFEMEKDQLKFLMNERNKILGIGDLPE